MPGQIEKVWRLLWHFRINPDVMETLECQTTMMSTICSREWSYEWNCVNLRRCEFRFSGNRVSSSARGKHSSSLMISLIMLSRPRPLVPRLSFLISELFSASTSLIAAVSMGAIDLFAGWTRFHASDCKQHSSTDSEWCDKIRRKSPSLQRLPKGRTTSHSFRDTVVTDHKRSSRKRSSSWNPYWPLHEVGDNEISWNFPLIALYATSLSAIWILSQIHKIQRFGIILSLINVSLD